MALAVLLPACDQARRAPDGGPWDGSAWDAGAWDADATTSEDASRFTLAVLPDTQMYAQDHPDIFEAQTRWLREQGERGDVRFVMHEGDVVNYAYERLQWEVASDAMGQLDGVVPYIIAPGNHDYGTTVETENAQDRTTLLQEYFPLERFAQMPTWGGRFEEGERVDNSYHLFSAGGQRWLILALEFGPRDAVVEWANEVLSAHPDHRALLVTHAYLFSNGERYDWERFGEEQTWNPHTYGIRSLDAGVNDGQELWDSLVSRHANVIAVLCGHVHSPGVARASRMGSGPVQEMLANFQGEDEGGAGFLRLLHVDTSSQEVRVETYSPWRDEYLRDDANQFSFAY